MFFVNLSDCLWQFLKAVSYISRCFMHAWLVLQRIPCVWGILSCAADILLGRKFLTGKSRISLYGYDTFPLREKKTTTYRSMLLCTWVDRSFQTAIKILGDFLKCRCFSQEAKVHYYYDLYVFVKICANANHGRPERGMYIWVINAAVHLRDINAKKDFLVLLCKIAESSFTVLEEKISIEENISFVWTSRMLRDWIILSGTFVFLTLEQFTVITRPF